MCEVFSGLHLMCFVLCDKDLDILLVTTAWLKRADVQRVDEPLSEDVVPRSESTRFRQAG